MNEDSRGDGPLPCRMHSSPSASDALKAAPCTPEPGRNPIVSHRFEASKFDPVSFNASADQSPGAQSSFPFDLLRSATLQFPADEQWVSVLLTPCAVAPKHFLHVMENLLRNPNITSSFLFRGDVLYDSEKDSDSPLADEGEERGLLKYMKADLKPRKQPHFDDFTKRRVVSRILIPRNPNLDKELVQTVWFLDKKTTSRNSLTNGQEIEIEEEKNLVIYVPHAESPDTIPFYHPKVNSLAVLHTFQPESHLGTLSIHYKPFAAANSTMTPAHNTGSLESDTLFAQPALSERLQRTALNLLRIVHKHSTGQQAGYKKRVHHDVVVDQSSFQNTYTRLKGKYAKKLMATWAEVTDPQKHVFEDLGIAAFLIELWKKMYGKNAKNKASSKLCGLAANGKSTEKKEDGFPGFVDIGCGNGVLVYILLSEGYEGWGFDVRERKSWSVFPDSVQEKLKEMVLVPEVLRAAMPEDESLETLKQMEAEGVIQNGIFPSGTFIISNHADQLTPWTPLLAYSSRCPFISIPCCSHALNGKLTRFYKLMPDTKTERPTVESLSSRSDTSDDKSDIVKEKRPDSSTNESRVDHEAIVPNVDDDNHEKITLPSRPVSQTGPGPRTGSLARPASQKTPLPSAYAGFTAHVMWIAGELGYQVENEILRIPSTRNHCIVARNDPSDSIVEPGYAKSARDQKVLELLRSEIGDVSVAAKDWVDGALAIKRKAGGGH